MKAVIQRVSRASVKSREYISKIGPGLMALVAVKKGDGRKDAEYIADKILNLRIFSDDRGKLNYSVKAEAKEVLIVPQFTLYGNCDKGRRPSFENSAGFSEGKKNFNILKKELNDKYIRKVKWGIFGKKMSVELVNDGPVTLIVES
ncbi:MAG: D-aminoacyl-tRNA deacylase [Elusimicrobiota bacterium]